jgi:drug/metabolite transporter (DMT)-like permease
MIKTKSERFSIALSLSAVTASALTMLWLLRHFPLATIITALFVLAGVVLIARLAKTLDADASTDLRHPDPSA